MRGATVTVTINETGQQTTGYTNDNGQYSVEFTAPYYPGDYTVTVEITDYTLTAEETYPLHVRGVELDLVIDLELQDLPAPHCQVVNEPITLHSTVYNLGYRYTAENVDVDLLSDGLFYYSPPTLPSVEPGEQTSPEDTSISYSTLGWHWITTKVDPENTVAEDNEYNNTDLDSVEIFPAEPDLIPVRLEFSCGSPRIHQPIDITVRVMNGGGSGAWDVECEFYDDDSPVGRDTIDYIGPFRSIKSATLNYSFATPGYHTVKVFADPDDNIAEYLETNNIITAEIYIRPTDLKVDYYDLYVSNPNPQEGEDINLMADVHNFGYSTEENVKVV